jgi:hypothetical protein
MIPKSIYDYIWFGTCVRFLQDVRTGTPLGPGHNASGGSNVRANLELLFVYLESLGLQVTLRASRGLRQMLDNELAQLPDNHELTPAQMTRIVTTVSEVRQTLAAECEGFEAYIVTPKRLDVKRLLTDVPGLLAPGVFMKLPDVARYDLTEAGTCIAFERPTAAAFHLLRTTESVMREFYRTLVRRNRLAPPLLWGPMVIDLRARRRVQPYTNVLETLDHIRRSFRNPTQHPEKIYDIQEVQDLWGLCVDSISRMAAALPARVAVAAP